MQVITKQTYTPAEYLELEEKAEYKSEYNNGQIFPMTGGSINHNRISGNLYIALSLALKQQEHEAFIGDVRLWIPNKQIYTYPDVLVIAGEPQYVANRTDTITNAFSPFGEVACGTIFLTAVRSRDSTDGRFTPIPHYSWGAIYLPTWWVI